MSVVVAEDRSMCVQPHQLVRTTWVDIDLCRLGFRMLMSPEAVEKKFRRRAVPRRNLGCEPGPGQRPPHAAQTEGHPRAC
jgi:hypothetical protein